MAGVGGTVDLGLAEGDLDWRGAGVGVLLGVGVRGAGLGSSISGFHIRKANMELDDRMLPANRKNNMMKKFSS